MSIKFRSNTGNKESGGSSSTPSLLFFAAQSETRSSEEGVWSLGGEARFVLAAQDPVGEGELDLGVLRNKSTNTERHQVVNTPMLIN